MNAATTPFGAAAAVVSFLAATTVSSAIDDPAAAVAVSAWIEATTAIEDPRVRETLARVDGAGRRLLALRSYLRAGPGLASRWSWTSEQIAAYESSPEAREQQAEIRSVQDAFARANPGYELWVNPQLRSLDIQIERWNTTPSIAEAAGNLQNAAAAFVGSPEFRSLDVESAQRAFREFLAAHVPHPTPTLAAPGLSPHGQKRAVDFHVQKGGLVVAGPTAATIAADWDAAGWTVRLQEAVRAGSKRFVGPLAIPREPWHYTYVPGER